jgi:hypothetical protein
MLPKFLATSAKPLIRAASLLMSELWFPLLETGKNAEHLASMAPPCTLTRALGFPFSQRFVESAPAKILS